MVKLVDILATSLLNMGIEKDDIVVLQLPNIIELTLCYLALWRIGVIISPVPVQWRAHELDYVLQLT